MDFPEIIRKLPKARLPYEGVDAYVFQGQNQQVVFTSFHKDVEIPEHSHAAEWGVVLEGEIELTVNGETRIFRKGDVYYIPANAKHSAKMKKGYKEIVFFNENRFELEV